MVPENALRDGTSKDKGCTYVRVKDRHGQEKAGVLQEKTAREAGRVNENHRADAGRRPYGGRRSNGGPGGQGGELLYQGVSLWHDQYGPHNPEHDRRGAETHPNG